MRTLKAFISFGIISMFFSTTTKARLVTTCEDIIPSSYALCAHWVYKKYCNSDKYGNQVKMFCRKSCEVCKDNQVGPPMLSGKYVGCFNLNGISGFTAVPSSKLSKDDITVGACVRFCHLTSGSNFAALMLGRYCYCGNSDRGKRYEPHMYCNYQCPSSNQQCGGSWPFLSIYEVVANQGQNNGEYLDTKELEEFILGD